MFPSGDRSASALYLASAARDTEIVALLVEHGANMDIYGGLYNNPLQVASKNGDIAIVQALLNASINVNRKGGKFGTALTAACHRRRTGVVRLLLEHGADPNIQGCWEDDNALQTACEMGNADIVLHLLEHGADPNLHGGRYGSALHAAFSQGNEVTIRALLAKGADVTYRGGEYWSILQAAVYSKNEAAVRIALECGLSANEKGGWFTYPLLRATAVESCPDSIVRLLLEEGADSNLEREGDNFTERTFRTALQHTTSLSKANLLLEYGAKVNAVSGWLGTALNVAMYTGGKEKIPMMRLLLEHEADVNQVVEAVESPLRYACRVAQLASAQILIEAGADINSVDIVGHSALHTSICQHMSSGLEIFDYLVGLDADPLLLDRRGCSGLHYAARANNLTILKKILERGPDVDATDDFGWTPLHWAAASTRKSTEVIRALLDAHSRIDLKDKLGRTASDLATIFKNIESIAILDNKDDADIDPSSAPTTTEEPLNFDCDGCGIVRSPPPLSMTIVKLTVLDA